MRGNARPTPRYRYITSKEVDEMLRLRRAGVSYERIRKLLDRTATTVRRHALCKIKRPAHSPEFRAAPSAAMRQLWSDPGWRAPTGAAQRAAAQKKPAAEAIAAGIQGGDADGPDIRDHVSTI